MAEASWDFAHFKPQAPPKPALQVQPAAGELQAVAGRDYRVRVQAPGLEPVAWSVHAGTLPAGWELGPDGTLGGPVDFVGEWPEFVLVGLGTGDPKRVVTARYTVMSREG